MYGANINDELFASPTTKNHNLIIGEIKSEIRDSIKPRIKSKEAAIYTDTIALVYYGSNNNSLDYSIRKLVDLADIEDLCLFRDNVINKLNFIEPDLMLFDVNGYITNKDETRLAGVPDLIVEVWSPSNSDVQKQVKFDLYSASSNLEHWYIEQDSNIVKCFLGTKILKEQNIKYKLVTVNNIEIDISHLSLITSTQ